MVLVRSSWRNANFSVTLCCLFVFAPSAGAQALVEFGGGWNEVASVPTGAVSNHGWNLRVSIDQQLAERFMLRVDASASELNYRVPFVAPCPVPGCSGQPYTGGTFDIAGLSANGLLSIDPRGILYVVGGTGLYNVHNRTADLNVGVSAGAGVAVPIGRRLCAVVEARAQHLFGPTAAPSWLVPITAGLRYSLSRE
jgi:hypothetical protein